MPQFVPGRRRSSSFCTSSFVSGRRGGTPSITQPTAPPCDSPKVVTRKAWPKVLPAARTTSMPRRAACPRLVGLGVCLKEVHVRGGIVLSSMRADEAGTVGELASGWRWHPCCGAQETCCNWLMDVLKINQGRLFYRQQQQQLAAVQTKQPQHHNTRMAITPTARIQAPTIAHVHHVCHVDADTPRYVALGGVEFPNTALLTLATGSSRSLRCCRGGCRICAHSVEREVDVAACGERGSGGDQLRRPTTCTSQDGMCCAHKAITTVTSSSIFIMIIITRCVVKTNCALSWL